MIHPTAIISSRARLGANVTVGPYSIIGDHVTIHDDVEIAGHVVIEGPCEIGEGTRIYPFASVGQPPQDLKFRGEETRLVIGRRNVIRESVTMNRGTAGGGALTSVGDDNLFMAQSHIAHDCIVGSGNVFANSSALAGHVTVGDHAFIGGFSKVVKDALPYARTDGVDAKCYGANTLGLRRKGFSGESIRHIRQAFRLLLASNLNTAQALERIKAEMRGAPEIDYLVNFIETSERGVTK